MINQIEAPTGAMMKSPAASTPNNGWTSEKMPTIFRSSAPAPRDRTSASIYPSPDWMSANGRPCASAPTRRVYGEG
jgi:hypothetical protein